MRHSKHRLLGIFVSIVAVMALAAPALAEPSPTVVLFRGDAVIDTRSDNEGGTNPGDGDGVDDDEVKSDSSISYTDCENGSNVGADDTGLNFPHVAAGKNGCWGFNAPSGTAGQCIAVGNFPGNVDSGCTIEAAGFLGAVGNVKGIGNLGAWCGMSRGWGGTGFAEAGNAVVDLKDVGWIASAGSVLPVNGAWHDGPNKGTILALVQASGGQTQGGLVTDCLTPNGAEVFTVNGIAVLL